MPNDKINDYYAVIIIKSSKVNNKVASESAMGKGTSKMEVVSITI